MGLWGHTQRKTMQEPTQPDRKELINKYEETNPPTDTWVNYGDANPGIHGGIWISYNSDMNNWEIIETRLSSEMGFNNAGYEDTGDQYVMRLSVSFDELFTNAGDYTDRMETFNDSMHNSYEHPIGLVIDEQLTGYVAHFATGRKYTHRTERIQEDSYVDVLDRLGINPRNE